MTWLNRVLWALVAPVYNWIENRAFQGQKTPLALGYFEMWLDTRLFSWGYNGGGYGGDPTVRFDILGQPMITINYWQGGGSVHLLSRQVLEYDYKPASNEKEVWPWDVTT